VDRQLVGKVVTLKSCVGLQKGAHLLDGVVEDIAVPVPCTYELGNRYIPMDAVRVFTFWAAC
jgi:hypothetical protein